MELELADERDDSVISPRALRMILADFTNPYDRIHRFMMLACSRLPGDGICLHASWPVRRLLSSRLVEAGDSKGPPWLRLMSEQTLAAEATCAIPLIHEGTTLGAITRKSESSFPEDMNDLAMLLSAELHAIVYPSGDPDAPEIVGRAPRLRDEMNRARQLARSCRPMLINGLPGTGKEYAARDIHRRSGRGDKSFIRRSAAAIPEGLEESTLFGHEKGAFTGANDLLIGWLETADGGTLYLDEISRATLKAQGLLLRVLSESELVRVGGSETIKVNVRLIVAANVNLDELVDQGKFLADLRDRLCENEICLPSLRERLEDIELLVRRFLGGYAPKTIAPEVLSLLATLPWKGNIRELQRVCAEVLKIHEGVFDLASVSAAVERVCRKSAPLAKLLFPTDAPLPTMDEAVADTGRRLADEAMARCEGDSVRAARMVKMTERTFRRCRRGK